MHVKSLMGLKFWRSWGVDKNISKSQQVGVFLKNHAKLHLSAENSELKSSHKFNKFQIYTRYVSFWKIMLNLKSCGGNRYFAIKFSQKWLKIESMRITEPAKANEVKHEKSSKQIKQVKQSNQANQSKPAKQRNQLCKHSK